MKKIVSVLIASLITVQVFSFIPCLSAVTPNLSDITLLQENVWQLDEYSKWLSQYKNEKICSDAVKISDGNDEINEGKEVTYYFNALSSGLYRLKVGYVAQKSKNLFSSPIEMSVKINGKIPYRDAYSISLSRVYESVSTKFDTDDGGNQIQPEQVEKTPYREQILTDAAGFYGDGLLFFFNAGKNTVTISAKRGGFTLKSIETVSGNSLPSYEEYKNCLNNKNQNSDTVKPVVIEAENIYQKSDCTITPVMDRTSSAVTPNSPSKMLLNTVGSNFCKIGQWVSWKFNVSQSGFYSITFFAKQNVNTGAISTRKMLIDGSVPFAEAQHIIFPYTQEYRNYTLSSNGENCFVYLEKGEHILTLETALGDMGQYLNKVSNLLSRLNDDYLKVLFYTGSNPDIYRDYHFENLIPDVLSDFSNSAAELKNVSQGLQRLSHAKGNTTAVLDKLSDLLKKMGNDTDEVAENFSLLKENLSALGTWLNDNTSQPIQIDSITVTQKGGNIEQKKENFLKNLVFKFRILLSSFADDYNSEKEADKTVNVWIASGKDQSSVIGRLLKNDSQKVGIKADVSLVSADALLPNVLAGSPIDVFLNAAASDPINYAIRGAVLDLTQFKDYGEVSKRFHPSALTPFTYKNKVYALPESFDFPLMFYRKDIFSDLGLSIPKTWDDFYEVVSILQKNNLTTGITWNDMFNLMLYQSGGSYYNGNHTKSALGEYVSLNAFEKTVKFFTDYGLPVEFSFPNRFRSGEMPLGIVSYTMYNQLYLFAPEISGLWEFTNVPGTVDEDGSINNSVIGSGTGAVILKTTKNKDAAWTFLKWWTNTDTQIRYGNEMERVMGVAARQSNANIEVVRGFPWSSNEFAVIDDQWHKIEAIPQVPGSYYIGRTLEFTFNSVYSAGADASRTLLDNVSELDEEIKRKMKEFEDND